MLILTLFAGVILAIGFTLAYVKLYIFSHWKRLGIPSLTPSLPFGNLSRTMMRHTAVGVNIAELYRQTTAPFVGIFLLWRPAILIRDAALTKRILGPDFVHFHDRGVYSRPDVEPISDSVFAMEGQRWRTLRAKLTPMFTSGRIKNMVPTVVEKSENLMRALQSKACGAGTVDIKDYISRQFLDTIASVFFGIDVDTITNRRHEFRVIEKQSQSRNYVFNLVPILIFTCPGLLKFMRLPSLPPDVKRYIMKLMRFHIAQREGPAPIVRKDFIQCLIQIRNGGAVKQQQIGGGDGDDDSWTIGTMAAKKTMSVGQCAAQIFIFYVAGFDTSSSLTSYTIFEVARNRRVRDALYADIEETLRRHDGKVTYDSVNEMRYLEWCVLESLRKYPILPLLNRICTKDYAIPAMTTVIPKGTAIIISLLAQSRDPQYFPEPLVYRPERFSTDDPTSAAASDAFIPFGDGPRMCLGLRLGKVSAKVAIVKLLLRYHFEPVSDAELELDNYGFTLQVKGGIPMRLTERVKSE